MPKNLERYYGLGHLHFITLSCYRRRPSLGTVRSRNIFVQALHEVPGVAERLTFCLPSGTDGTTYV